MDTKFVNIIKEAKKNSSKKKFEQTVEFVMNFKGLDLKKPEHQMDFFLSIKHPWKKTKICALVGPELIDEAKKHFDKAILSEEFSKYKDKKAVKKLAREYDFFVAQANLMPQIATTFGRYFGPVNKMPNPKSGSIVPPNANLQQVKERLEKTVRVLVRTLPSFMIGVGKESGKEELIAEDIQHLYDQIIHHLPGEKQNLKSCYVKLTMGKPVRVD